MTGYMHGAYNAPTQRQLLPAGGGIRLAVYLEK